MQFLFSPDSKFMQIFSRLTDIILLNVVFLLTCVPIFTIGAANAALYTVCFRMDTEREQGLFRTYFRAFRDNFRQGTVLWLTLLLFGTASLVNILLFLSQDGVLRYVFALFIVLFVLVVMVFSYTFPLLSQFHNSIKNTLKNAILLSIAYLPRSIVMAAINLFPWVLLTVNLYAFLELGFLWLVLYFGATAYFNSRVLHKVFKPYWKTDAETE